MNAIEKIEELRQQLDELRNLNEEDEVHFLRAPEFGITCAIMYEKADPNPLQKLFSQETEPKSEPTLD